MHISALQTFLTILEQGSLVRASERLNVTQSTITARLKALEHELGQRLVNRHKSGVTPTAPGLRLKRYAETMTELWRQARQETALPNTIQSMCNIGCHPDLWPGLGRDLFEAIRACEPVVALSVWHGGQADLEAWQTRGLIDLSRGEQIAYPVLIEELIGTLEEEARALGCFDEVQHARKILDRGTSSCNQLSIYAEAKAGGADDREALISVVDWLVTETAADLP